MHLAAPVPGLLDARVLPVAPLFLTASHAPSIFLSSVSSPFPSTLYNVLATVIQVLPSSISMPSQAFTLVSDPNPVLAWKPPEGPTVPLSFHLRLSPKRLSLCPLCFHPQLVIRSIPNLHITTRFSPLVISVSSTEVLGTEAALATLHLIKLWLSQGTGYN